MPNTLVLFHDSHYDLVDADAVGDRESLGAYTVLTPQGEQQRHKVAVDEADNATYVELPDDFAGTPMELVHLIQTLSDRHSDAVTGVSCSDEALGRKVAALMGVANVETHTDADAVLAEHSPAPVTEAAAPAAANDAAPAATQEA